MGANSFLYEMTLIYTGCNNENDRVASPGCAFASVHGLGQHINPHHANCPYCIPLLLNLNRSIHTIVIVGGGGGGEGKGEGFKIDRCILSRKVTLLSFFCLLYTWG